MNDSGPKRKYFVVLLLGLLVSNTMVSVRTSILGDLRYETILEEAEAKSFKFDDSITNPPITRYGERNIGAYDSLGNRQLYYFDDDLNLEWNRSVSSIQNISTHINEVVSMRFVNHKGIWLEQVSHGDRLHRIHIINHSEITEIELSTFQISNFPSALYIIRVKTEIVELKETNYLFVNVRYISRLTGALDNYHTAVYKVTETDNSHFVEEIMVVENSIDFIALEELWRDGDTPILRFVGQFNTLADSRFYRFEDEIFSEDDNLGDILFEISNSETSQSLNFQLLDQYFKDGKIKSIWFSEDLIPGTIDVATTIHFFSGTTMFDDRSFIGNFHFDIRPIGGLVKLGNSRSLLLLDSISNNTAETWEYHEIIISDDDTEVKFNKFGWNDTFLAKVDSFGANVIYTFITIDFNKDPAFGVMFKKGDIDLTDSIPNQINSQSPIILHGAVSMFLMIAVIPFYMLRRRKIQVGSSSAYPSFEDNSSNN